MSAASPDPVHFLLVDDLEENLLALQGLLRRDGLVLLKARSGEAALELLLQYDVALALVDVQMPEMDGFELAELMRGTERTRRVPIIFLTAGTADRSRRFRGYEAGAVDFLQKPIEPDILKSKADVFFELYRQRQEISRLLLESREQAEALRAADRRKDEFLATLAHELRNPLAPVRTALQILKLAPGDPAQFVKAQQMMVRQLSHMVRLIDDLLDISRISTGKIDLKLRRVRASSVLDAAIEASRPALDAGGHELTVSVPDQDIWLDVDPMRVAQMLNNLLTNAAKYTPEAGKITLTLRTEDRQAVFEVSDTGVGIPEEMLSKVFDMFTQVDRSLDRAQGGLGIGLSLVKSLTEMHGGSVRAYSQGLGRGSTFTVRLPLASAEPTQSDSVEDSHAEEPPSRKRSLRVLIVDDNVDGAESLAMLLQLQGHETATAHSGPDALRLMPRFQADIVFLDIGLPGMNGYDVAQQMRAEATFGNPTLVALTGWGSTEDRRRSSEAGFDYHVTKPVEPGELESILAEASAARTT